MHSTNRFNGSLESATPFIAHSFCSLFYEIAMSLRSKSVGDNTYQHRPTSFALTNAFQLLYYIFLTDCEECTVEAEAERWSSKYYTTATKHELMQTHKNPMHFMEAF